MTDNRNTEDLVEDLDLPADQGEHVKGGIQDGTSNTVTFGEAAPGAEKKKPGALAQACATGKHFPTVSIN
jgi:hypothetical protein